MTLQQWIKDNKDALEFMNMKIEGLDLHVKTNSIIIPLHIFGHNNEWELKQTLVKELHHINDKDMQVLKDTTTQTLV